MWGSPSTELEVREYVPTQNDLIVVDLTDDTDGPVTRVQKVMYPDQAETNYPIGKRFRLEPIEEGEM
jgi:hypothetical protein